MEEAAAASEAPAAGSFRATSDKLAAPYKLPPPFPVGTTAVYSVEPSNPYILRVDVSATGKLEKRDQAYVLARMSEPWVTVIVKGATQQLQRNLWNWDYVRTRCADLMYHKFRVFQRATTTSESQAPKSEWIEKEWTSMTIGDYGRYLDTRKRALDRHRDGTATDGTALVQVRHTLVAHAERVLLIGVQPRGHAVHNRHYEHSDLSDRLLAAVLFA